MFLQFELWKDCKHGCPFCWNRGVPRVRNKVAAIEHAKNFLQITDINAESISLIGGEFFDGQLSGIEVYTGFYELVALIAGKIHQGETKRFLICTSLMYKDTVCWDSFMSYIKDMGIDKQTLICTSWDSKYRFNEKTLKAWETNVARLHEAYPNANLHVQMVLTQFFIDSYLIDGFRIKDFEQKWNCRVDFNLPFKCYGAFEDKQDMEKELPGFFPRRNSFFKFLLEARESEGLDAANLIGVDNHCDTLFYTLNDRDLLCLTNRHNKGHTCLRTEPCTGSCCGYIDSDRKMLEDAKGFTSQLG